MLIEVRKGVFFVNPDQSNPEKADTLLKVLHARTENLEASFSTLFQAYTFEKKEDEDFGIYEGYTVPSTAPTAVKYSTWSAEKAALKEKSDKKISGYVPYYGGAKDAAPGVATGGSAAPTGSKYATYDAGATAGGAVGEKDKLVNEAMARMGGTVQTGAAHAPVAGGSKYQSYDPSAAGNPTTPTASATPHSNYQAYNGGQ